jgi:mannose-6-phosphate isomerase class I
MDNLKLFEYAILWHPNEDQSKAGERSKIVVEPKYVLSKSEKAALIQASQEIPQAYQEVLDQIQIAIRPF